MMESPSKSALGFLAGLAKIDNWRRPTVPLAAHPVLYFHERLELLLVFAAAVISVSVPLL